MGDSMDTVVHVNQLLESLERAQEGRLAHLQSLEKEINEWQHDESKPLFEGTQSDDRVCMFCCQRNCSICALRWMRRRGRK